jgi:exopolysaccharide biosynthesis polyprenyl glycosylphosphotransferase
MILTDIFSVSAAWYLAYFIRFHLMAGAEQGLLVPYSLMWLLMLTMTILYYIREGLYEIPSFKSWSHGVLGTYRALFKSIATFILVVYIFYPLQLSRLTFIFYGTIAGIIFPSNRILIHNLMMYRRKKGISLVSILVIGNGNHVEEFVSNILEQRALGTKVVGWIDGNGSAQKLGIESIDRSEMLSFILNAEPDRIVIGYKGEKAKFLNDTMRLLEQNHHHIFLIPDFNYNLIGYTVEEVGSVPLIHTHSSGIGPFDRVIKRVTDIAISILGLIILSPLMTVVLLLVVLTSKGPVFYSQERVTLDGRLFMMHKFRTMREKADKENPSWTVKNDERITAVGKFLRKTSIDELPQLWNVLKGDMSIVGPRPERPHLVSHFAESIPNYIYRHRMKTGITGWAQVNGWRGNTSLRRRIDYDIYYIKNWSLLFDTKIILMTFYRGFVNENAY